jgi:hypothetical protein
LAEGSADALARPGLVEVPVGFAHLVAAVLVAAVLVAEVLRDVRGVELEHVPGIPGDANDSTPSAPTSRSPRHHSTSDGGRPALPPASASTDSAATYEAHSISPYPSLKPTRRPIRLRGTNSATAYTKQAASSHQLSTASASGPSPTTPNPTPMTRPTNNEAAARYTAGTATSRSDRAARGMTLVRRPKLVSGARQGAGSIVPFH